MQPAEGTKEKPRVFRGFKCHPGKNRGLRVKPGLAGRGVGLLRNGHGERREGTGGDGRASQVRSQGVRNEGHGALAFQGRLNRGLAREVAAGEAALHNGAFHGFRQGGRRGFGLCVAGSGLHVADAGKGDGGQDDDHDDHGDQLNECETFVVLHISCSANNLFPALNPCRALDTSTYPPDRELILGGKPELTYPHIL